MFKLNNLFLHNQDNNNKLEFIYFKLVWLKLDDINLATTYLSHILTL